MPHSMQDLKSLAQGIKPLLLTVEAWSANQWITREFLIVSFCVIFLLLFPGTILNAYTTVELFMDIFFHFSVRFSIFFCAGVLKLEQTPGMNYKNQLEILLNRDFWA